MSEREVILLGDHVVYRDNLKGFDELGVVVEAGSCLKVLWNGDDHPRSEIQERLRGARLDEVDAGCRVIQED
ncbi:phosphohistidine phosphatase [Acinetobacter pittii]|uniref:phosphohistidine phosphatase n=1 Tax=Acinetobacter pittii TaxID=48296 RepID=UPI001EEA0BE5|nr:phosphohistidine phosphatase [Acinetobacter pittii]